MKTLNRFIEYFIPGKITADDELLRKARFIVIVTWVLAMMGLLGATDYFTTHKALDLLNLVGFFLALVALFIFRKTGSFAFIAHFVSLIGFVGVTVQTLLNGGLAVPDSYWILTVPVWAYVLGNSRIGFFWTILSVLMLTGVFLADQLGWKDFSVHAVNYATPHYFFNIVLLVFFVVFVFERNERIRSRLTNKLRSSKKEIEEKNREITDSINYAQRIQHLLLASDELLKRNLPEFFLLYKPKDIVSGDFYWAAENEKRFLLLAGDCTGHGVPGAFMSLLNISFLNELVTGNKMQQPDQILNAQRERVIGSLSPTGKESARDGMDCTLCNFDFPNRKIQFACANNPLWILRKGKMLEFGPDKLPVGIHEGEQKPFTLREEELQTGDCIYLMTDGFADQFGGPKGKKFKYKQLQEILVSAAGESMDVQKQKLQQAFESWKGTLEQVDDVLIIGVRIR